MSAARNAHRVVRTHALPSVHRRVWWRRVRWLLGVIAGPVLLLGSAIGFVLVGMLVK